MYYHLILCDLFSIYQRAVGVDLVTPPPPHTHTLFLSRHVIMTTYRGGVIYGLLKYSILSTWLINMMAYYTALFEMSPMMYVLKTLTCKRKI